MVERGREHDQGAPGRRAEKKRSQSNGPGQTRGETQRRHGGRGRARRGDGGRGNRNDHRLLAESLAGLVVRRPQGLCLDKGYDYASTRTVARRLRLTLHLRTRGEKAHARRRGHQARRWVVERTHSWLNRFRRLLGRWEKKAANYEAMLHLACATIVAGQAG